MLPVFVGFTLLQIRNHQSLRLKTEQLCYNSRDQCACILQGSLNSPLQRCGLSLFNRHLSTVGGSYTVQHLQLSHLSNPWIQPATPCNRHIVPAGGHSSYSSARLFTNTVRVNILLLLILLSALEQFYCNFVYRHFNFVFCRFVLSYFLVMCAYKPAKTCTWFWKEKFNAARVWIVASARTQPYCVLHRIYHIAR